MKQITGNLFDPPITGADAICITTNGFVKKNGEAVMGRGCALEAVQRMPGLPEILGNAIRSQGNQVYAHGPWNGMEVITFPVKDISEVCAPNKGNVVRHMQRQFEPGQRVPGWACKARLSIIMRSAHELVALADARNLQHVVIPRPGCGAGELLWADVQTVLDDILDNRFYAITFPPRRR